MSKQFFGLLIIALLSNNSISAQNIILVNKAKSVYSILIPPDANAVEKQSASVLQDYIFRISNCTLPIISQVPSSNANQIIIGRNSFIDSNEINELKGDGILIKKVNNSIILTGGIRKGVLYSIYTLLEDYLNCRMYTEEAIYIPKKSTISLPASIYRKEVPDFEFRMTYFVDAFKKNYCDFHKINYWIEDWGLWVHSFQKLLPKEKYFQIHPEYYSLVYGKRVPDQLCLTNPDVLKLVIQNLRQLMNENPNAKYWSVSQNDNVNYCQCNNCKRLDSMQGSQQGSLLSFVNDVAKQFPNKTITTLAYQYSETPPKTIKPLSNVMIMLCTSSEDRRVPVNNQVKSEFNNNFKKWSLITSKMFVWNYIVQFSNALSPFPNLYTLQPDIRYFASKGATHMFEQGIGEMPAEFSELRCYMVSQLMWNKDVDIKQTMKEFINGYYGSSGAPYISRYIALIDKNASDKPVALRSGGSPLEARNSYLSLENIQAYKKIFEQALKATNDSIYFSRITKEYLAVLFAELEIKKSMIADRKKTGLFDKNEYTGELDDFYKKMGKAHIIYLNEIRADVDDYFKDYTNLINKN